MSLGDAFLSIGPTVVALAAIGAAFAQQNRTLRNDRELRDLDAVRDAAAAAAVDLSEAQQAVFTVGNEIPFGGPASPTPRDLARLEGAHSSLRFSTERLRLLLGADHELVRLCEDALEAVWDAFRIADYGTSAWDTAEKNFSILVTTREAFARAARSAVGALLPGDRALTVSNRSTPQR